MRFPLIGLLLPWLALASPPAKTLDHTLRFEPNRGQARSGILYTARGNGYRMDLDHQHHVLHVAGKTLTTTLTGASSGSRIEPIDILSGTASYLRANDGPAGLTSIPAFSKIRYNDVYPGTDLVFYGREGKLEYDFILAPHADPSRIRLTVSGRPEIAKDGDLVIGDVRWNRPVVYQESSTGRTPIAGRFVIRKGNEIGFEIGAYDRNRTLVIDPVLSYATYFGGSGNDVSRGIAVDTSGNVYIAGNTSSQNLPNTGGSVQAAYGGEIPSHEETGDAFVAKYTAAGALAYVTYFGGSADEAALGIAVDAAGNAYVTGYTNSTNFKTTSNAYQTSFAGQGRGSQYHEGGDAFLVKLNPAGNSLLYSTFFGGALDDRGTAIALDPAGNIYIAGNTLSTNLPVTSGALQPSYKGGNTTDIISDGDIFVAKFSTSGTLMYSTYLGGAGGDSPTAIAVDAAGNAYITGQTTSSDFPTTAGALQTKLGGTGSGPIFYLGDAFVSKINPTGTALVYSTYLGGNRDDWGLGIAVDAAGSAYVTGMTSSSNFPVSSNAPQKTYSGPNGVVGYFWWGDGFVTKLNPAGTALVYSTYFGGSADDAGWAIAIDGAGNAYVGGSANSTDFKVSANALQKTFGGAGGQSQSPGDGVLLVVNPDGTAFTYASYYGGGLDDAITAIAVDKDGAVYASGTTLSTNLAVTTNAAQKAFAGKNQVSLVAGDTFLAKFTDLVGSSVTLSGVANAANYVSTGVSPGEIIVLGGSAMGPATLVGAALDSTGKFLATTVSDTRILFDGVPAPIVYTSATQSAAIVPYGVAGKTSTQVQAEYKGVKSAALTVAVKDSVPGLFSNDSSGKGQGAIYNEDNTRNGVNNPAQLGHIIVLFGTGEGQTSPAGTDGKVATDVYPVPALPVSVTIGGAPATVLYAGAVPYQTSGLFQINVTVPTTIDTKVPQDVVVSFGPNAKSQLGLTVALKP